MRHPLTSTFLTAGWIAMLLAAGFSMYNQIEKHSHPMNPNGWVQDESRVHPLVNAGAGFAVCSGLCFLAAAIVNGGSRKAE